MNEEEVGQSAIPYTLLEQNKRKGTQASRLCPFYFCVYSAFSGAGSAWGASSATPTAAAVSTGTVAGAGPSWPPAATLPPIMPESRAFTSMPNALGDALGDLGGAVDDVLQQLGAVALAVHGDLVHLGEGLRHVLGDGGQGVHHHLDDGRPGRTSSWPRPSCRCLRPPPGPWPGWPRASALPTAEIPAASCSLAKTGGFRLLFHGLRFLLLLVPLGLRVLLPLEQGGLGLLLLPVPLGVRLGPDLRVQGLLGYLYLLLFQLGFPGGLGDLRIYSGGTDDFLLGLVLNLIGGFRLGPLVCRR